MRAKQLADEIGAWHLDVCIDGVVSAVLTLFQTVTGMRPRYKVKCSHCPHKQLEQLKLDHIMKWLWVLCTG